MSGNRLLWPDLEPEAIEEGFIAELPEAKFTSGQVLDALAYKHADFNPWNGYPATWIFAREVQRETGVYGDTQRFDGVAVGLVPSVKYARVVYEVKVSRSDWLRELKPITEARYRGLKISHRIKPIDEEGVADLVRSGYEVETRAKWAHALDLSNELWFVAPPKCILPTEVPEGCGLMEVRPWGADRELRTRTVVKAPWRETPHPGPEFWAAVLRRVGRASWATKAQDPAA